MLYVLTNDLENDETDALVEGECPYLQEFPFDFNEGDSKLHRLPQREIVLNMAEHSSRGRMPDHLFVENYTGLFLSDRFFMLFDHYNADGNLEFIPVKIVDNYSNANEVLFAELRGEELDYESTSYNKYFITNVVGLVDCVEHSTSSLEYYTPRQEFSEDMPQAMKEVLQREEDNDIDFIKKLVLDEAKIPEDLQVFRLKDCPRILIFKEKLVNAIREEGLTGFVFVPLAEYTDEIPDDDDETEESKPEPEAQAKEEQPPTMIKEESPTAAKPIIIKRIKKNG